MSSTCTYGINDGKYPCKKKCLKHSEVMNYKWKYVLLLEKFLKQVHFFMTFIRNGTLKVYLKLLK